MEDVCKTLMQQNMIFIQEDTPPPFRPSPGQSIKFPRGRKNGLARRQLQKLQTQGKDTNEKHAPDNASFVPPKNYEIEFDREKVNEYLRNWEKKGYVKLKPDKLQWTPYLTTRIPQEANLPVLPAMDTTLDDSSKATSTRPNTPAPFSPASVVVGGLEGEDELPVVVETRGRTRIQMPTKLGVKEPLSVRSTRSQRPVSASPLPTPLTPSRSLRTRSSNGIILRTLEEPGSAVRPTRRGVLISKSSSRTMEEVVNNDEAFAAKLALEEQMQHRQLRSRRNETQSENKRPVALPVPKARKRRRIDSSPEVVGGRASEEQGAGENVGPMEVDPCMHTPERTLVDGNNPERMEEESGAEREVKLEDADTPLTSRQSVPSDDTVAGSNYAGVKEGSRIFTAGVIDLAECHDEDAEGEEEDADGSPDPEY